MSKSDFDDIKAPVLEASTESIENDDDDELDEETTKELDYVVGSMFSYREDKELSEPTSDDVNGLVNFYLMLKEHAYLYGMINNGDAIVNLVAKGDNEEDEIQIVLTEEGSEHHCPHCQDEADAENELNLHEEMDSSKFN